MIDVHLHVLNNLDDGSRSLAESLGILQNLTNLGFTEVICTPHFMPHSKFDADNKTKSAALRRLRLAAKKANLKIKLHLGNEIYIHPEIVKNIKAKNIHPIGRKHLLFELPFYEPISGLRDIIHDLKLHGYIPILAHPERYTYFQKDKKALLELKKSGLLFQCNYGSLIGQYGRPAKRLAKFLLKNDTVSFLGTDIHRQDAALFTDFPKVQRRIIKLIGEPAYQEILHNANNLLK